MSTPDSLLIAWWLLTIIFVVSGFLIARRQRLVFQQAAVTAALRRDWRGLHGLLCGSRPPTAAAVPRMIGFIVLAVILIWLAGFIVLIWMGHWTSLLLLNFQLLMVLFGVACLAVGLSPKASAAAAGLNSSLLPRVVMRPLMISVGLVMIAFGSYWMIADLALPRLIVEGRIDRVSHSGLKKDNYSIVIDGHAYDTLRDIYLAMNVGDRVRAEVGAGSKTILHAERIGTRARPARHLRP